MAKQARKMALYWVVHVTQNTEPMEPQAGPYYTWSDAYDDNKNWIDLEKCKIWKQIVEVIDEP